MKARIVYLVLFLSCSIILNAQVNSSISLQAGITKITSGSYQGMLTYFQRVDENIAVTAAIGYSGFEGRFKNLNGCRYDHVEMGKVTSIVPFRIGGRYYFSNKGFYPCILFEYGINRVEKEYYVPDFIYPNGMPAEFYSVKYKALYQMTYGLGFGAMIPILADWNIDINCTMHHNNDLGEYVSLMVGANYLL